MPSWHVAGWGSTGCLLPGQQGTLLTETLIHLYESLGIKEKLKEPFSIVNTGSCTERVERHCLALFPHFSGLSFICCHSHFYPNEFSFQRDMNLHRASWRLFFSVVILRVL